MEEEEEEVEPPPREEPNAEASRASPGSAVADPLAAVLGHSTWLRPVLDWTWPPQGRPYLSSSVQTACVGAYARASTRGPRKKSRSDGPILIRAADFIAGTLSAGLVDSQAWTHNIDAALERVGASPDRLFTPDALSRWKNALPPATARLGDAKLSWDAVAVLAQASRLRQRTNTRHESIGLRHVCFAALTSREGQQGLSDLGLLADGLQDLVSLLIEHSNVEEMKRYWDDPEQWKAVFAEAREQRLLIVPPTRPSSGFTSDLPIGRGGRPGSRPPDPLGTRADAIALADLILLEAAQPPLAIGLFGSWGSGKSTLMSWLKEEIEKQTEEEKDRRQARKAAAPLQADDQDPETRRVANVPQVEFNAWSFIDSQNLWASLTSEIFDQLRVAGDEGKAGRALVKEVAAKFAVKQVAAGAAESVAAQKELELDQAEAALEQTKSQGNPLADAAKAVLTEQSAQLPAPIADALRKLFDGEFRRQGEGVVGRWRSVWKVWREAQPWRSRGVAALTLLALATIVALALPNVRASITGWWASLPLIGFAGAASIATGPLRAIFSAFDRYAVVVNEKNQAFEARVREKAEAVDAARLAHGEALTTKVASSAEAADLAATVDDPARLLTYLLTESADIQTVRSHLGLLGSVRRCFESLDELILERRGEENSVDRILLYIDDLDRCNASQVVQILEAVHLLLAFNCFVVIVAIDARWLRHSLEISHPQFKPVAGIPADSDRAADLPTPSDYLEKIFQIPFWVRDLATAPSGTADSTSPYTRYLNELLGPPPTDPEQRDGDEGAETQQASGATTAFKPEPPTAPEQAEEAAARVERVLLTKAERTLLDQLGALAAKSPRAVKRLVNIYRLIRARISQDQENAFLTGGAGDVPSFAGVQFALALDAGLPADLVADVRAGIAAFSDDSWSALAQDPMLLRGHASTALPSKVPSTPEHIKFDTLKGLLRKAGRLDGFIAALVAVKQARGGRLDRGDIERAFALTHRYSFRAT